MASVLSLAPSSVLPRKSELSILGALISSGAKPASDPRVRCVIVTGTQSSEQLVCEICQRPNFLALKYDSSMDLLSHIQRIVGGLFS